VHRYLGWPLFPQEKGGGRCSRLTTSKNDEFAQLYRPGTELETKVRWPQRLPMDVVTPSSGTAWEFFYFLQEACGMNLGKAAIGATLRLMWVEECS
jgi:hypothetical protein